jgi:hypothetical protein
MYMSPITHTLIALVSLIVFYYAGMFIGIIRGWREGNLAGIQATLDYLDEEQLQVIVEKITKSQN